MQEKGAGMQVRCCSHGHLCGHGLDTVCQTLIGRHRLPGTVLGSALIDRTPRSPTELRAHDRAPRSYTSTALINRTPRSPSELRAH